MCGKFLKTTTTDPLKVSWYRCWLFSFTRDIIHDLDWWLRLSLLLFLWLSMRLDSIIRCTRLDTRPISVMCKYTHPLLPTTWTSIRRRLMLGAPTGMAKLATDLGQLETVMRQAFKGTNDVHHCYENCRRWECNAARATMWLHNKAHVNEHMPTLTRSHKIGTACN